MARRSTVLTGAAGEHFVMYKLLQRNHLAALTPTGARAVDILISDEDGGNLAAIQVKTSGDPVTVGWRMDQKHEAMKGDRLFYCFVDPGPVSSSSPTCWIVPSAVVAEHVYATHRAWLAGAPLRGSQRKDGPGRKMHLVCANPPLDAYPVNWMDPYKEAWELLDHVDAEAAQQSSSQSAEQLGEGTASEEGAREIGVQFPEDFQNLTFRKDQIAL